VECPAEAQDVLERSFCQQEVREGYHLGLHKGCLAQVAAAIYEAAGNNSESSDTFDPIVIVKYYDPASGQYGVTYEELESWTCPQCTLINNPVVRRCVACQGQSPNLTEWFLVKAELLRPLINSVEAAKKLKQLHCAEVSRLESQKLEQCNTGHELDNKASDEQNISCTVVDPDPNELTLIGIQQWYVEVDKEEWKLETIIDIFEYLSLTTCVVIICETARKVDFFSGEISKRGFPNVVSLTNSMGHSERHRIVTKFCSASGASQTLVTQLPEGRGIDSIIANLSQSHIIINCDVPRSAEAFLRCIGRISRVTQDHPPPPHPPPLPGGQRTVLHFVTNNDVRTFKEIEKQLRVNIEEMPMDIEDFL
jgi:hypothetical protein